MKNEYKAPTYETSEIEDMVVGFMCACSASDDNPWTSPDIQTGIESV